MPETAYYVIAAYAAGIPTAFAFGRYMQSYHEGKSLRAAAWDAVICVLASVVTLSLWSSSGDSPLVLAGWALGNATGTYFVTKYKERW